MPATSRLAGKKVLIAEDDPIQACLLGQAFQKAGAAVEIARDGKSAQDLLAHGSYDAFVTEWMLPELDGIEIVPRLRETASRPYIVLVSALNLPEARAHALQAGADEFIPKPLVPPKVIEVIAKGVQRRAHIGARPSSAEVDTRQSQAPSAAYANHPVARTDAWKGLPEVIRGVVADLLQVSPKVVLSGSPPWEAAISYVLVLVDAEHLMELHLRLGATRACAMDLARCMLGDRVPDDEATLVNLLSEVANIAAGSVTTAFVAEGYLFTPGLTARAGQKWLNDYAVSGLFALHADSLVLSVTFGVRPRNGSIVMAHKLRAGMVLAESLYNDSGGLILPVGTRLTTAAVSRLQTLLKGRKVGVCVPDAQA